MEKRYEPKTVEGKFMEGMHKKVDTPKRDEPKVEIQSMKGILKDITQVPERLHMTGSPDQPSAKPAKEGENQLQTGKGKDMLKSTMTKEY